MTKCYVCNKKTERIVDSSYFNSTNNVYKYKTGLFSSIEVVLCENCDDGLCEIDPIPSPGYWADTNHFLSKEGMLYIDNNKSKIKNYIKNINQEEEKEKEKEAIRISDLGLQIQNLLKEKAVKIPASDIDAFLKHQDVDEIKEVCESLYQNGKINRTANYRYFILTDKKKKPKPKKAAAPKSQAVDVKAELKKYKEMLDDGLITQEQYDAKSNKLLGL